MSAVILLSDFTPSTALSKTSQLLLEKFQSSEPATYPISYKFMCANFTTLTSGEWTIDVENEYDAFQGFGRPSGLFIACKQIFDSYLSVEDENDAFSEEKRKQETETLWKNCRASDFYGDYPDGMELAFKDLEQVFDDGEKLAELEKQEELYISRVLNWLKFVNGREGGDSFGDHAPVFKFSIIRTSYDYRENRYETELIPMLCDCKHLKYFTNGSIRKKIRR